MENAHGILYLMQNKSQLAILFAIGQYPCIDIHHPNHSVHDFLKYSMNQTLALHNYTDHTPSQYDLLPMYKQNRNKHLIQKNFIHIRTPINIRP